MHILKARNLSRIFQVMYAIGINLRKDVLL